MQENKNQVYIIGNTHFDPVWLWTWDEGLASIRSTLRAAIDRMKENPDFHYSFSLPMVFKQIEIIDPCLFADIKEYVKRGQFNLEECMWVQPDCFSASGESYVRQCLYAQNYLKENFGVTSKTALQADCFGSPASLPQILRKTGVKYAVFGRPNALDMKTEDPLFMWCGPDGSEILSWRCNEIHAAWDACTHENLEKDIAYCDKRGRDFLNVIGVTNHGGAPTKKAIAEIREWQKKTGRVKFSSIEEFFIRQEEQNLSIDHVGEIPISIFGVFYDRPDIKKANRDAENAIFHAEKMLSIVDKLGYRNYPLKKMQEQTEILLYNQFHDILGGSSIEDACGNAMRALGGVREHAEEQMHYALQCITSRMDLKRDPDVDWNIVVFNPHAEEYNGLVEAGVQFAWEFSWYEGPLTVVDHNGIEIPCQKIWSRECIPGFRARFVFPAKIPSLGYTTYRLKRKETKHDLVAPTYQDGILENPLIRVVLDTEKGGIKEIYNKEKSKVCAKGCAIPYLFTDMADVWCFNYTGFTDKTPFHCERIDVVEEGPYRTTVLMQCKSKNTTMQYSISLAYNEKAPVISYTCDFEDRRSTLRLAFEELDKKNTIQALVPYGMQKRTFDGMDSPCGPGISLQGEETEMQILSDSIFAYSAEKDGTLYLDVVRSPIYGDLRIKDISMEDLRPCLSLGILKGKIKILLDEPVSNSEEALRKNAESFISAYYTVDESNHDGILKTQDSFVQIEGSQDVLLTTMKEAEDGSGDLILRLQNTKNSSTKASVHLSFVHAETELSFKPFEIKTVRFHAGQFVETDMLE